jgi:hypothetical protein
MRNYLIISEEGRVKGKISIAVLKITEGDTIPLGDLHISKIMNRGIKHEAVNFLVEKGFVNKISNLSSLTSGNYISAGLPTLFTDAAMNEFARQWALRTVPPQGFVTPTIGFTGLQRWTTSSKYWQPGQAINP